MMFLDNNHLYTEADVKVGLNLTDEECGYFFAQFIQDDFLEFNCGVEQHFYFTGSAISKALLEANRAAKRRRQGFNS